MDIDYRLAFELAPVGLVLSRQRVIVDCNRAVCEMFGTAPEHLKGQSFQVLYPSADEFERTGDRIAPVLGRGGTYADNRIMRRLDGRFKGETFWCHVTGRALIPRAPHEAGIWSFEDLSASRPVKAELTAREREVAALLLEGMTSKEIGRALRISHRTVEIYRAQLMRKFKAGTTGELVRRLIAT
jgi:PAS domain S-box-containing protein